MGYLWRTKISKKENEGDGAYATSYEHLSDELMRLDIRIHLKLLQDERVESSDRDRYGQGMYITRDEVLETIQKKTNKPHDANVLVY